MNQVCQCMGLMALLSEGADGFIKAEPCSRIRSLEPEQPFHDDSPDDWYEPKSEQELIELENKRIDFEKAKKRSEFINDARIPNLYLNALRDDFYQKEVLQWRDEILSGNATSKMLFFFGGVGAGKTHTAIFLLMSYLQGTASSSALYLPTYTLVEKKRCAAAYSFDARSLKDEAEFTVQQMQKKLRLIDFLVLDELGQEKLTPMESKLIFDLIDHRHSANKITILISNHCDNRDLSLDGKKLSELVGARISSRLKVAKSFHFSGPDYRAQTHSETITKEEVERFTVPAKILAHGNDEQQIMTWLTRNPAFEVVSTQKRQELTEVRDGEELDKDRPVAYIYKDVWVEGDKLIVQGPICDHEDKKLYALLVKELANSHKDGNRGLTLKISLNEILRLSKLAISGENTNRIKRQLNRLVRMSFDFRNAKGNRWYGPLLSEIQEVGASSDRRLQIHFSHFMITFYKLHAYTAFNSKKSHQLKGDSSAFYLFYSSHSAKEMAVSVDRCKKLLAIDENFNKYDALKRVKKAVDNLIKSGVMHPDKTFVKDGKVHTCLA